jgi:ferritin-like metal-binding protein YciE
MDLNTLKDLYVEQLKDLYSAETQLVKALPKMAKAASSPDLRNGFEEHLRQTEGHVQRLEQIFQALGEDGKGKVCKAMQGLIAEGEETINEEARPSVKDAALIAAAQRVEHYEIAGYGTVRTYAAQLGEQQAVNLLEQTLNEEKQTDEKLSRLAQNAINPQAQRATAR